MLGKNKIRVMAIFLSVLLLLNGMGGIQAEAKTAVSPKKLVLSSKNKTLYVGQKSSIKVKKVTPSKASKKVTYHSSNKKVVFVSKKGVLKAKKAGKATITVVSKLNARAKTKCKITVKKAPTKITLKQTSKMLKAGESFQVGVKSIKPKNAYNKFKYKSSNTEVATVNSKGLVIAKTAGTAVITVASPAGKKVSAKCNVVVEEDGNATQPTDSVQPEEPTAPVVPNEPTLPVQQGEPTGIQLNKDSITLEYGKSATIRAIVLPLGVKNQTVTWSSSNSKIVSLLSVSDGVIFGNRPGDAVITASTVNGFTASCNVHVNGLEIPVTPGDSNIPVESVSFNSKKDGTVVTEATLVTGGYLGLAVNINPSNATDTNLILSSSNESVATVVDQGLDESKRRTAGIVGGFPGTTYITATIGGKTTICKLTIEEPKMAANYTVPYIATRSFNALPTTDENVVIPYYMTDDKQSEYVAGDTTKKLNLVYEVDGTCKIQPNLSMGEGELNLGKLPAGEHSIGIQAEDTVTGKRSHRVYLNVLVTESTEQSYQVLPEELADVADGKAMTDKLNTIFTQKAGEGISRILLPENGSYTIDGTDGGLKIPSGITVDLNGSTIKMAVSKGTKAAIVTMENVENAHITGGVLIGDRGEAGASGAVAVRIKGGRYCTVSDMQIKNISGNAYVTERVDSAFKRELSDGEIKRRIGEENFVYSQTIKVDLTELKKESDYLMVGCQRGKMIVRSASPNIYIRFYDSNQQLISTVEGYQHRQTKIPENAQYADAEFCGGVYGDDYISFYFNALGENLEVKNVRFENISGTAILPSTFNNLLVAGCTFTNVSGRTATISQGGTNGAGGGWTEAQDLYFCNNQVTSGYKDIYFNTGRNIYLDNLKGQNITLGSEVLGGTIRNMNDNGMNINWIIGSKIVCGYARIFDNNCKNINVTHIPKDKVFSPLFECRIKNCTIGGDSFNSNLEYIEYVNCTFTNFKGEVGVLRGCTLNNEAEIGKDIIIYTN